MKNISWIVVMIIFVSGCDFFEKKAEEAASHLDFGFGQAQKAIDQNEEKIRRVQAMQRGLKKQQQESYSSSIFKP